MICTWKNCSKEATQFLCDKNDRVWARLCTEHYEEHEKAFDNLEDIKGLLKVWVLAQGGAKKLSESDEVKKVSKMGAKLVQCLQDIRHNK